MIKKSSFIIGIIVVIVVIIACLFKFSGTYENHPSSGYANISWIDCIKADDATYTKDSSDSTFTESEIDKEIGTVKFQVHDSIHYVGYKIKNWDATFLYENTKLFSIKNDTKSIAALVDGIYYKYTK